MVPLGCFQVALFQNSGFAEDVDLAVDVEVPAVDDLTVVLLLPRVDFLDVVLGVLDYDFVWLAVQSEYHRNLVPFTVLNPPGFESETLNVIYRETHNLFVSQKYKKN